MPRDSKSQKLISDAALGSLMGLGGRLKEARLRRNWTQALAAEKAGLSESSIKKVEGGSPRISVSAYLSLLDVYGMPRAFDRVMAPGDDTLGEALSRSALRQRARSAKQETSVDEWEI
jgi:transcriptional regulator with XRE-family HTH domain